MLLAKQAKKYTNVWKSRSPTHQDDTRLYFIKKYQDSDGMCLYAIEGLAKQYV